LKTLGEGSSAVVKLAINKDMQRVAIKICNVAKPDPNKPEPKVESKSPKRTLQSEMELLKTVDHKNIVKVFEAIEGTHHMYLVMEYCGPVSLREYLDTTEHSLLQESEACLIFSELAKALVYLHSKKIYHRDLKLDNIMIGAAGQVKLVDFGLALSMKDKGQISSYCGTPCYMSPEIFSKKKYYPDKADVWSFGICLYRSLVGCFPFNGSFHTHEGVDQANLAHLVKKGEFEVPDHLSPECQNLIKGLLNHCPSRRPSTSEVTSRLNQILMFDWFKKSVLLESTVDSMKNQHG
jgi:serine/threonine protein kinase